LSILAAAALVAGFSGPAWASGVQHIPNGLSDFMGGVLPPPGFYWLNYLLAVDKTSFRDDSGDKLGTPFGESDLRAHALVDAVRLVYMTPFKILGATYGAQIILPIYEADVNLTAGGTSLDNAASSGIGDITFNPIILAWHFSPNFHMGAGLDIVAPTGPYQKEKAAAQILNKNHWTFEPLVAVSYWVPNGFDASAKIMYDFHTDNTDHQSQTPAGPVTDTLKPGQEFHFDWAASYAVTKEDYRLGLAGFYYTQTTKDKIGGVNQDIATQAAIGPAFKWWPGMGKFSVTAKYLKEFATKNQTEGQSFWIDSVVAF
jgi:hypothetical protein